MTDGGPQLVEKILRQADIDTGDEYIGAQTFKLANPRSELFPVLIVRHSFTDGPDPGPCPILSAKEAHSHTTAPQNVPNAAFFSRPQRGYSSVIDGHER